MDQFSVARHWLPSTGAPDGWPRYPPKSAHTHNRGRRSAIPALPFCHVRLKAQKPKDFRHPPAIDTMGDHLRKARLDRGLLQKDVAQQIGVAETTVHNWERSRTAPSIRLVPALIKFLGYTPHPEPSSFSERLIRCRRELGLSRRRFASIVRVDESTLARWERGHPPSGIVRERIDNVFMARQKK